MIPKGPKEGDEIRSVDSGHGFFRSHGIDLNVPSNRYRTSMALAVAFVLAGCATERPSPALTVINTPTFDAGNMVPDGHVFADGEFSPDMYVSPAADAEGADGGLPRPIDAASPDAQEPDAQIPDADFPDTSKPDSGDATAPTDDAIADAQEADAASPDSDAQPDTQEPDAQEPDAQPDAQEPDVPVVDPCLALDCDDENVCTIDSCVPEVGCQNTPTTYTYQLGVTNTPGLELATLDSLGNSPQPTPDANGDFSFTFDCEQLPAAVRTQMAAMPGFLAIFSDPDDPFHMYHPFAGPVTTNPEGQFNETSNFNLNGGPAFSLAVVPPPTPDELPENQ